MYTVVNLYSENDNDIFRFLNLFFDNDIKQKITHKWEKIYANPIELADIIGTFIENNDKFHINMWISLDKDIFINVTENNANEIIKYLYERYPS